MDELVELILELMFEGIIAIGNNKKISKWIRYPLMIIMLLLVLLINGLCFLLGIVALRERETGFIILGIILILCGVGLLLGIIKQVKKYWDSEKNETSKISND